MGFVKHICCLLLMMATVMPASASSSEKEGGFDLQAVLFGHIKDSMNGMSLISVILLLSFICRLSSRALQVGTCSAVANLSIMLTLKVTVKALMACI